VLQVHAKHKPSKLLNTFLKIKNKEKLHITIFIANVVLLIGGTTIHSLFGLSIDKNTIL
jgi:sRNA-binding regulator protein Hfq